MALSCKIKLERISDNAENQDRAECGKNKASDIPSTAPTVVTTRRQRQKNLHLERALCITQPLPFVLKCSVMYKCYNCYQCYQCYPHVPHSSAQPQSEDQSCQIPFYSSIPNQGFLKASFLWENMILMVSTIKAGDRGSSRSVKASCFFICLHFIF